MPIDVAEIGCDLLSATSRKFLRGPRGAGLLYVSGRMLDGLDPAVLDLYGASWVTRDGYEMRQDARRFELWERSPAIALGVGAAADYAAGIGLEAIWERVRSLARLLRSLLSAVGGVVVHDIGAVQGAIVTFTVEGSEAEAVKATLGGQAINVSTVTPYSARYDMEARGLPNLVRASVHYFNTEEEIERLVAAVARM
jgi:selenocysteine lyase/cysteine desulfurase